MELLFLGIHDDVCNTYMYAYMYLEHEVPSDVLTTPDMGSSNITVMYVDALPWFVFAASWGGLSSLVCKGIA